MSTLNVDKVDPSTGTTLELGTSGDTVNLGSGVTAGTGFGGDLSFGGDTFGANKVIGANDAYSLSLETSGNTALTIDANGIITKPLQPAFSAYASAGQAGVSGTTWIVGAFNTEVFDINADYDTTTYTFTAPVTGKYLFTAMFTVDNFTGRPYSMFYTSNRNYTISWFGNNLSGGENSFAGSNIVDMDASDTCLFQIYAYDDTAFDLGCYYFTGALLC